MRSSYLLAVPVALSCFTAAVPAAEPLRGAADVLKRAADQSAKTDPATKPPSDSAKLRADLTNFTTRAASLAPAAAAREWLELGDRFARLPMQARFGAGHREEPPPQAQDLLMALPPPAAWDELAKAIGTRPTPGTLEDTREFGLRMLGQALTGDRTALARQASAFEALLIKAKRDEAMQLVHVFRALDDALRALSDDPKTILASVERQLTAAERDRDFGNSSLNLPDLVGVIGQDEATPYVHRALLSKASNLSIEGKTTQALARQLALAVVNEMKVPRWGLVESLDAVELYEALEKKFAQTKPEKSASAADALADLENGRFGDDSEKQRAKTYYLMALIVRGRTADAAQFARRAAQEGGEFQVESAAVAALERAGFTAALDKFLHELLAQTPELPYWETYFSVAARTGNTERMLTLARTVAAKPDLAGEKSGSIRENLYRALLAADQVEEGVKELRALLATAPKATGRSARSFRTGAMQSFEWDNHALTLARLGHLLEKPEWVAEGLVAAMPKTDANANPGDEFANAYQTRYLVEVLVQVGRLAEAEKLLADQLTKAIQQAPNQRGFPEMAIATGRSPATESLKSLTALYHRAGRHDDVLVLLEQSSHWGVKDLAQLLSPGMSGMDFDLENFSGGHYSKGPKGSRLAQAAAAALIHAGRKAEARAIVDTMLDQAGGDDRAYELLVQLAGQEAMARLDAVFARDQFEERPLIWKALLLHQAGKHEEAEKVARQAIAIDPSDGEQGKGDRMRVYAVLADIRAARGDQKEAEFLRGVVRAIRLSEQADDFHAAGLLSRGVRMYQDSLKHFADAYCIQSRLAVQLTELGQHELAAKHYEKAFELMPDSFGRVESHCFGCESTFAGTQAQSVAERVFTTLAAKNPNKPQIHYLLGYLRQQQERGKDALPHFRRALQLDTDYLNAWEHLGQLGQEHRLPAAERDDIAFNVLRLDPLGRHTSANLGTVSDLRRLWTAVEAAAKFQVKAPTTLLPLPASRDEVEKHERTAKSQPNQYFGSYTRYGSGGSTAASPGQALAQHQLLTAISGLIGGAGEFGFGE